jgi:hypothetical protein
MMSRPLKSHIVPRSYLQGFTPSGAKGETLWVLDTITDTWSRQPPGNVGWRPDFYRVDQPGIEPTAAERDFEPIETRAIAVIRTLVDPPPNKKMPRDDFLHLLYFIAHLWARSPKARKLLTDQYRPKVTKAIASNLVSPRRWAWLMDQARRADVPTPEGSFERMRSLAEKDQIELAFPNDVLSSRNLHLTYLVDWNDGAMSALAGRRWGLAVSTEHHFVTSDHPVVLHRDNSPLDIADSPRSFADSDAQVVFPIHRDMALVGTFDGDGRPFVASRTFVAAINTVVIANAERHVFSPERDFTIFGPEGEATNIET